MPTDSFFPGHTRSTLISDYQDAFVRATGLRVETIWMDEPERPFLSRQRENRFCRWMGRFAAGCAACEAMHARLQQRLAQTLTSQVLGCFAGLAEVAVPVMDGDRLAAVFRGGQVFQRKPDQAQFAKLAGQLRGWGVVHELPRVRAAFFSSPVLSPVQLRAAVRLLEIYARLLKETLDTELLAEHGPDHPYITSARDFIQAHAGEPLSLEDVAAHLHLSTHHFSKLFKKGMGIGFSEFLRRVRVERAKQSLLDLSLPISEVAGRAGFGSLSQFNRAFQRSTGCSPREYRLSLLETPSRE